MSRERLWTALAILLPALATTIAPLPTEDLAYQVRAGDLMLATGTLLRVDPFTFTAFGQPWLNQQWGAAVMLAAAHGPLGWGGLALVRTVLVAAAAALVLAGCRVSLDPRRAAWLALAGFLLSVGALALRAQLLGLVCFAAVVAILAARARHPRLVWAIPIVVVTWANLHGSFFLGPVAVGLALLDDLVFRRPGRPALAAVLGLSLVATCVSPFGPDTWRYAVGLATDPAIAQLVSEWQRTSPLSVLGAAFYLSVALAALVVWRAWRRGWRLEPGRLLWLAGLAALGAYAERGVAWWALGAPVAIAPVVAAAFPRAATMPAPTPRGMRRLNAVIVAALVLLTVVLQPLLRPSDGPAGPTGLLRDAPTGLAQWVADSAQETDRVVVPQAWGSWFEWAAPRVPIMVDSRIELFDDATWQDYLAIAHGGPGALAVLDRTGATVIVVDGTSQPELDATLRAAGSGWRQAYADADGTVFTPAD